MANTNPSLPCEGPWTHATPPPPEARREPPEKLTGSVSLETCAGLWEASETTELGSGRWGHSSASLDTLPLDAEGYYGAPARGAYPVPGSPPYGLAEQTSGHGIFLATGLEGEGQSKPEFQPGNGLMTSQAFHETAGEFDHLMGLLTPKQFDHISQLIEYTGTGSKSKCFAYISDSAALEVQGIHTDQPDDGDDDILSMKFPDVDLRLDEGGNDTGGTLLSSAGLLTRRQDAPSPKAANPRSEVSSHENYAMPPGIHTLGFNPATQSSPAATETVNSIVEAAVLPVEADKDESSGHLAALLRPVAPERTPETKEKGGTLRPAGITVLPKSSQPLPSAGGKTTKTTKRRRKIMAREKAYERLEPFSDKEKERRRRDAIRAKRCRDKKNEQYLTLMEKYKAVCAERDHLACALAQSRQREKALREHLQL